MLRVALNTQPYGEELGGSCGRFKMLSAAKDETWVFQIFCDAPPLCNEKMQ
jgi:hypothetical protein